MVKKARKMAAEFQTHVDDMVRDADLHEVRDGIRQIRSLDIRGTIARAVDSDGSIRRTLMEDPIRTPPPVVTTPVEALPEHTITAPDGTVPDVVTSEPPTRAIAPPWRATGRRLLASRRPSSRRPSRWRSKPLITRHSPRLSSLQKRPSAARCTEPDVFSGRSAGRPPSTTPRCRCCRTWWSCGGE